MFSAKRLDGAPQVPTIAEAGGPPIEAASWVMFMAPPGTPDKIVNRIYEGVREVLSDPELLRQYTELLMIPKGGTPEQTALFLKDEVQRWGQVIQKGNIKVD
jgi:tripartite-type tricarboxylate transporter receptor subunit TctC